MELIPILSTIILVATIATFILAVAAYILYKVRERRARAGRVATPIEATTTVAPGHTLIAPTVATPALATPALTVPALAAPVGAAPALAAPAATFVPPAIPAAMPASAPAYGTAAPYGASVPYGSDPYGSDPYGASVPYGSDPYGSDPYGSDPYGGYGARGLPPIALDTNADGYADTVYEPRPTFNDPYGTPTSYAPSRDYGFPGDDGAGSGPAVKTVSHYGAPSQPSLFYELTSEGMAPVAPSASPTFQPYPTLGTSPVQASLDAEQQHRAALDAAQAQLDAEQRRLQAAEDASRDRSASLRENSAGPNGLAWL